MSFLIINGLRNVPTVEKISPIVKKTNYEKRVQGVKDLRVQVKKRPDAQCRMSNAYIKGVKCSSEMMKRLRFTGWSGV